MRIGILGGTFDPVHHGHIMMAVRARDILKLEKVLLIPAGRPMAKGRLDITSARHRLAMLEIAIENVSGLEISRMEIDRPGSSYTVETIEELRKSGYENDDIWFIIGLDNLDQLKYWYQPERLIQLCRIAAVARPGYEKPAPDELEKSLPGLSSRVDYLEGMDEDISATGIRKKVVRGESIDDIISEAVVRYITEHNLYKGE